MKTRIWVIAAAVWGALYVAMYLKVASDNENGVAWWYVAVLVVAIALTLQGAAARLNPRRIQLMLAALTLFVLSALLGILTIGILLVPAIVATAIALQKANGATAAG